MTGVQGRDGLSAGGGGKDMGRLARSVSKQAPAHSRGGGDGDPGRVSSRGPMLSDFYFRKNALNIDKQK